MDTSATERRMPLDDEMWPATEQRCPYCCQTAGPFRLHWWAERQVSLCGACREHGALSFDLQADAAGETISLLASGGGRGQVGGLIGHVAESLER